MTRPLTGAALTAHQRKVLIDAARQAITRRPAQPEQVAALIAEAARLGGAA